MNSGKCIIWMQRPADDLNLLWNGIRKPIFEFIPSLGERTTFLRTNKILSEHRFRLKQKPTMDGCFQQNTREIQHKYGYWIWGNT